MALYRTSDPEAASQDQLQGVRLEHLPRLCHETRGEEGRACRVPLCLGRGQGDPRRGRGAAHPHCDRRSGRAGFRTGGETVMFRHEKTFVNQTAIGAGGGRLAQRRGPGGAREARFRTIDWSASARCCVPTSSAWSGRAARSRGSSRHWRKWRRCGTARSPRGRMMRRCCAPPQRSSATDASSCASATPDTAAELAAVAKENDHALVADRPGPQPTGCRWPGADQGAGPERPAPAFRPLPRGALPDQLHRAPRSAQGQPQVARLPHPPLCRDREPTR